MYGENNNAKNSMQTSSILKERIEAVKTIRTKYEGKRLSNLRILRSVANGTDSENLGMILLLILTGMFAVMPFYYR